MKAVVAASVLSSLATCTFAQDYSADDLARRTIERRAVETVICGVPIVNYDLMYQAMVRETKGAFNQIVYWSMANRLTVRRPIVSTCRQIHLLPSIGPPGPMAARPMRRSEICPVPVVHHGMSDCKRTLTDRWTFTSGLKAPAGKESNWVPTSPSGQFEVLFRFYGPTKPLFDKTWTLPDIEKFVAHCWKQLDNFPHGTFDPSLTLIRDHYIFQGVLAGAAIG